MAPPFMVSAPGKVIVFGEHAAVYNQPAIAAAISLRSYLLVTTLSKSKRTVRLNFKDIGLDHTWALSDLPWNAFQVPCKKKSYHSTVNYLDEELLDTILPHAEAVSLDLPEEQRKIHIKSATAFLYLFLSLGSENCPGFVYTLRSTIPTGAGLGSSASVCVCLSAAMLLQTHSLAGPHPQQPREEAMLQVERINQWAFVGEMCIHGSPSGVDNTVASRGAALPLLLVDTQQSRSTSVQLQKVITMRDNHPRLTDILLDGIGQISAAALEIISPPYPTDHYQAEVIRELGPLIRVNHGLLVSLGVSHPRIERVCQLVDDAQIGWTKLTGAGGGGCAIALFQPEAPREEIGNLIKTLADEGFKTNEIVLGADGFQDIDLEKFENAVDAQEIEELVGE
ncbi:mevalonate kinase [Penicillium malachiteum]|uniref:Mevalonate kinase n=1 Tax=Penicillium malachiteum TaxID=1324776 RepID=A0AAD6MSU5_9EURO|nr:mevalonate kinase [Penicillium malachiteum]